MSWLSVDVSRSSVLRTPRRSSVVSERETHYKTYTHARINTYTYIYTYETSRNVCQTYGYLRINIYVWARDSVYAVKSYDYTARVSETLNARTRKYNVTFIYIVGQRNKLNYGGAIGLRRSTARRVGGGGERKNAISRNRPETWALYCFANRVFFRYVRRRRPCSE